MRSFSLGKGWLFLELRVMRAGFMGCVLLAAAVGSAENTDHLKPKLKPGQDPAETVKVFVNFRTPPGLEDKDKVKHAGGKIKYEYNLVPAVAVELPIAAVEHLEKNPNVLSIELDGTVELQDFELDQSWGVKYMNCGLMHDIGIRGAGVKVGVIDSGVEYTHPDLNGTYAGGYDFINNDSDPMDDYGHGTRVTGAISAVDDNNGVVGAVPSVRLYALKVYNSSGTTTWSAIIAAIEWCVNNGINITNSSFGGDIYPGTAVQSAYDNAYARGVLHFAAAGNTGTADGSGDKVRYPARFDSVVAVASVDSNLNRAPSSSTGPLVEMAAPGANIFTTTRFGTWITASGTSFSSPHAAGAAALVWSAGVTDKNGNGLVNDEVRQALNGTARDIGTAGRDTFYGYGFIQVDKAVAAVRGNVSPSATPTKTFTPIAPTATPTHTYTPTAIQTPVPIPPTATPTTTPTPQPSNTPIVIAPIATPVAAKYAGVKSIEYLMWNRNRMFLSASVKDNNGAAIPNATVIMDIYLNNALYSHLAAGTGSNGAITLFFNSAPSGVYTTRITGVQAIGYAWDGVTPPNQYSR